MDLGLKDKLIVVTGGGAGIGAAISRACLQEGARVVVLGRPSQNVQAFIAEMQAAKANCYFVEAHLEDLDRCRTANPDTPLRSSILAPTGLWAEEPSFIRHDARKIPIKMFGYAVSYRNGHPHVRIEQTRYLELKAWFADVAVHRQRGTLERELQSLPFEPYAPVRSQLLCILREINRRRKTAQFELLPTSCIRTRRRSRGRDHSHHQECRPCARA